jgi:catechol 2,3-dioxygenase-like lactoylglutathione lyase family enzyme
MKHIAKSIRTFIGARNFEESRHFYKEIGFEESPLSNKMSYFKVAEHLGFYLQDAYVKDWINNSMIFLEVDDVNRYWSELESLKLHLKFKNVKLTPIREETWGRECFMHDPSGVLWHFGEFSSK